MSESSSESESDSSEESHNEEGDNKQSEQIPVDDEALEILGEVGTHFSHHYS